MGKINPTLVSLVIPVYNESANIKPLYQEIGRVWVDLAENYELEIVFVDDGSQDNSAALIRQLAQKDNRVKLIQFSRNFGKEAATSAGLHHTQGDAAIIIDADLQHPPELIPEFIKKWQDGAEVVVGRRKHHPPTKSVRTLGAKFYYFLMQRFGDRNVALDSSDYRLLDRKVVEEFKNFSERNRLTRGLVDWLGFKSTVVNFEAPARQTGTTNFPLSQLVHLSLSGLVGHSLIPLRLAGLLGVGITTFALLLGTLLVVDQFIFGDPLNLNITSSGLLALLILFLVGIVLISQGLLALYISNIHREVTNRPLYIIRETRNL